MTPFLIATPVGPLSVVMRGDALVAVEFATGTPPPDPPADQRRIAEHIVAWMTGASTDLGIALDVSGEEAFEQEVLRALMTIPRGETRTYGEIATQIGMPQAAQAVGNAVGRNPLPVVIPCHRVIRTDGALGGFSGPPGMKRALLALEGVTFPEQLRLID